MSQGIEKSQSPEVGFEPGLHNLKANTLSCCSKSRLLPQGSRSVSYRVPTSSGNHGKPGKSLKKSSMHGKIMEFGKT